MLGSALACCLGLLLVLLFAPLAFSAQDTARYAEIRSTFQRQVPCPSTQRSSGPCPGYEVTYVRPLCSGGADTVGNLKWQAVPPAKPGGHPVPERATAPGAANEDVPCA